MNADDTHCGKRDPETYAIIGAVMTVHRELGSGFLEYVYQEALAIEFQLCGLPFEREKALSIAYKGHVLACGYRADFICFESVIVEVKAIDELSNVHTAQAINYLKATEMKRALLINFGQSRLDYKRVVRGYP